MNTPAFTDQSAFDICCEWGLHGIQALTAQNNANCDVVIIVDVLSFSTCVEIAVERNVAVYPYTWKDQRADEYAVSLQATLAGKRGQSDYSLSPASLTNAPAGMRLVLPSPNGATLSLATGATPTLCGCLRNARAVAEYASSLGKRIAVIPAGERWEDGSVRFALEDLVGAGAIISNLRGTRSPESAAAEQIFSSVQGSLYECIQACASGRELIERGYVADIFLATEYNCSRTVPVLREGAYTSV